MRSGTWFLTFLLLIWSGNIGGCSKSLQSQEDVMAVTDGTFDKEVIHSDLPVLVDFWATWCGPCRMYGPVVDQVAQEYKGRLKVVRVDIDQNPGLARNYRISAIPNSMLFQNGQPVKVWVGFVPEQDVKSVVDQVIKPSVASHS